MTGRDYFELLKAGVDAQFEKLKEKEGQDKKSWHEMVLVEFINRLKDEMVELEEEFVSTDHSNIDWYKAIRREGADIANFAHMLILHCDKKIKQWDGVKKIQAKCPVCNGSGRFQGMCNICGGSGEKLGELKQKSELTSDDCKDYDSTQVKCTICSHGLFGGRVRADLKSCFRLKK